MSKYMAAQAEEVVELAKKYFCNINLLHLSILDKMDWIPLEEAIISSVSPSVYSCSWLSPWRKSIT